MKGEVNVLKCNNGKGHLRELTPSDLSKKFSRRVLLSSSVILPSQFQSYSICTEFARDWFLEKFNKDFFTHVHIDGKLGFDDLRKFDTTDKKIKRINPLLAIYPSINDEYNRDWIDSNPEGHLQSLRRTKMEGTFLFDKDNEVYLAIQFKSILMNFNYKMRVNTRAEQLDLLEFIKTNHRAGYTETHTMDLDVHVPKQIIAQIAYDVGLKVDDNLNVKEPYKLLSYLNSKSVLPFLYKFRCSNGNNEFFIRVPNCSAHIKMEMPSKDDGVRAGVDTTNYGIDFNIEVEMTAPMNYTYYCQHEQKYINDNTVCSDGLITVAKVVKTEIPDKNDKNWDLFVTTEYMIEKEDLWKPNIINMGEFLECTDMNEVLQYTLCNKINPAVFIDFKLFSDGHEKCYHMDWENLICTVEGVADNLTTVIAVYTDKKYINDVLINLKEMNKSRID